MNSSLTHFFRFASIQLLFMVCTAPAALEGVYFNGQDSYGEIDPWKPSGSFKVMAWFSEINPIGSKRTVLLSSSSTNEFLSFSHTSMQGRWGEDYPGIYGKFSFYETGYIEIEVSPNMVTVSDGRVSHSLNKDTIGVDPISYDRLYRRGFGDFSQGRLEALVLMDLADTDNSRVYGFDSDKGIVSLEQNISGTLVGIKGSDWKTVGRLPVNPAPELFDKSKWQQLFSGEDLTVSKTFTGVRNIPDFKANDNRQLEQKNNARQESYDSLLVDEVIQALNFNGSSYGELSNWRSSGDQVVVAWLQRLPSNASEMVTLLGTHEGDRLAFNHHQLRLTLRDKSYLFEGFDFHRLRYIEVQLLAGAVRVSDGQHEVELPVATLNPSTLSWRYLFSDGTKAFEAGLQGLTLIDRTTHDNTLNVHFSNQQAVLTSIEPVDLVLHHVTEQDWVELGSSVSVPKTHITNKVQWDNWFDSQYPEQRPLLNLRNGNDNDDFAWEGHYWLRAYLTMAQTYKDNRYLEYALELVEHMFAYTDEQRMARGELDLQSEPYKGAPKYYLNNPDKAVPGWRHQFKGWRAEVLADGMILSGILRVVDYIKAHNKTAYMAAADRYLRRSVEIIRSHDSSYSNNKNAEVAGSYHYVNYTNSAIDNRGLFSRPLPYNHSLAMATSMILAQRWYADSQDLQSKTAELLQFFRDNLSTFDDGTCHWSYAYEPKGPEHERVEDVNHGHISVGFLLLAHKHRLADLDSELQCMTNTLVQSAAIAPALISYGIDGSGVSHRFEQIAVGYDWLELQKYDDRILSLVQHQMRHYGEPVWHRPFYVYARLLWWRRIQL